MTEKNKSREELLREIGELKLRLEEAEETLNAIRSGEVDAILGSSADGRVYTLHGAEHPYRVFFEAVHEGAVTMTPDGLILFCNRRFAELVQVPFDKVTGLNFMDFVPANVRLAVSNLIADAGSKSYSIETSLLSPGGRKVPVTVSVNTLKTEDMEAVCAVVTDLSNLAVMEKLKTANEHLASINEELRVSQEELKVSDERLRREHGELEQHVAKRTREVTEARDMLDQRVRERTAQLQAANEILRASRLASLNLVEDAVAARRDAEKANADLRRSVDRFELLAATAGELLQVPDPQRTVESLCRKVMEYLDCHAFFNFLVDEKEGRLHLNACAGIAEEEAKRIEWLNFGVAVCGCAARDAVRIIAEHIPNTPDPRTELVKSYGIKAYCCHPLLGPGGKVIGTLSFGTKSHETFSEDDVSLMKAVTDQVATAMTRKIAEDEILKLGESMAARNLELESANKEMESFIYSISHDLRAPIRTMSGFANIIVEDYADKLDAQGKDYLSRIQNGAEKATRLIDDLLRLARISRQDMDFVDVDLSRRAEAVLAGLREANRDRDVEVTITAGLTALADPVLAEVILSNLLGNAWKFTSKTENARIEFGAAERDGKTVYFVKDNGAGFDPAYAEKMFWPFQRLHSTNEFEGTGIGLTIVERIVRRHGGRIWAEGAVGKGATFYFTLG